MSRTRIKFDGAIAVGAIIGRLTVEAPAERDSFRLAQWRCRCECGGSKVAPASSLRNGYTSSCGCVYRETRPTIRRTHGDKPKTAPPAPEYRAWTNMITRCTNPKTNRWHLYGGRGISVCPQWRNSYEAFLADVGRRPSAKHSLDRYPDQDGNYEPGNVRWATGHEQRMNQRRMKPQR